MSQRRKILSILIAGLILVPALLFLGMRQATHDNVTRQKLDRMLGQTQPEWPEIGEPPSTQPAPDASSPPFPDMSGGGFFGLPLPMPQAGVDVQETSDSYILRIPLADPKDASSIRLKVTPNRIEVSGQTGSKENGTTVTSSFMQAFTTSQEVLPGQVSRKTEQNGEKTEMVITIPKKHGSLDDHLPSNGGSHDQSQPDSDELPTDPNANPLDGVENKVI
jgi:HSP20 family molecular chaperone IbpA